jgi:hypothetical protein
MLRFRISKSRAVGDRDLTCTSHSETEKAEVNARDHLLADSRQFDSQSSSSSPERSNFTKSVCGSKSERLRILDPAFLPASGFSVGVANLGWAPGRVGRKNGACSGALGGSLGLFRF